MEQKAKFKLGWFNIFNLGGALYGWIHGHTWEDAAIGFLAGSILPVFALLGILAIGLVIVKGSEFIADSLPTRARIASTFRVETDEQRWEREYAEHCKANNLTNELGSSPIHREDDFTTTTTSSSDTSYWGGTTSGFGPG